MSGSFDPYHVWLGIPPEQQPPDHYRLLGIPAFEGNPDVIENAADQRMAHLRTFQAGRHTAESQRLLNEVAAAKVCLLGAGRKASYDAALHQRLAAQTPAGEALDPHLAEFLQRTEAEHLSAMRPKAGPAPGKGRPAGRRLPVGLLTAAGAMVVGLVVVLIVLLSQPSKEAASKSAPSEKSKPPGTEVAGPEGKPPKPPDPRAEDPPSPGDDRKGKKPVPPDDGAPDKRPLPSPKTIVEAPAKPKEGPEPEPAPGPWIDALNAVDVDQHRVAGVWTRDAEGVSIDAGVAMRFMVPFAVEGSYDLEVQFTRHRGDDTLAIVLPAGKGNCGLMLSWGRGQLHTIADVDHRGDNETTLRPGTLANGKRYTVRVSVRMDGDQAEIASRLDDQPCCRWKGESSRLYTHHDWHLPDWRCPGFASWNSQVTVHELRLRPVSGRGKVVPVEEADQAGPLRIPAQGRRVGFLFHEDAPAGTHLAGLKCCLEGGVRGVQAIYRAPDGRETEGRLVGSRRGEERVEKAKAGYAVGGFRVKCGEAIAALQAVFLRLDAKGPDPADAYESPWIGDGGDATPVALYGEGRPLVGIFGSFGDSFHSLGLLAARPAGEPLPRFLRLTEVEPLSQQVGWESYQVNQVRPEVWPIVPPVLRFCQEYLLAHAGSRLGYAIPKGSKSFSAVGYCAAPGDVAFQVEVDGQRVFSSGKARVARVLVDLPAKGKTLGLIVDNLGRGDLDHSFWLLPRFHAKAAAQVTQIDAADKHVKLTPIKPVSASVGAGELFINRVPDWAAPPLHVLELTPCDEFIFAHAPSRAVFAVPPGAKEFSAVGYCVASSSVQFQVLVDGKPRFVSPKAGIVPIRVPLPRGAKRLELAVESLGDNHWDSSFWCYPRIWW